MTTITLRMDDAADKELAKFMAEGGYKEKSEAIRGAIHVAYRHQMIERVRAQSQACAEDPDDLAEAQAVLRDMEQFRAW